MGSYVKDLFNQLYKYKKQYLIEFLSLFGAAFFVKRGKFMEIKDLQINEQALRDLYLKGLLTGEIQGPLTNKLSYDKPWLIHYSDEQILKYYQTIDSGVCDLSIYDYMMKDNRDHLGDVALYYFGNKITYRQLEKKQISLRQVF